MNVWLWTSIAALAISAGAVGLLAWNVSGLWPWVWMAAGLIAGGVLARGTQPWSYAAATACALLALGHVIWRALPIHSMEWGTIEKAEVCDILETRRFTVTDAADLRELERFARRCSQHTMVKSGFGWMLSVTRGGTTHNVYLHGGCFGRQPGGFVQTVFVPAAPGFDAWLATLAAKHGQKLP